MTLERRPGPRMHHREDKRSDCLIRGLNKRNFHLQKTTSVQRFNGAPDNLPPFHYFQRIILPPSPLGGGVVKLIRR